MCFKTVSNPESTKDLSPHLSCHRKEYMNLSAYGCGTVSSLKNSRIFHPDGPMKHPDFIGALIGANLATYLIEYQLFIS